MEDTIETDTVVIGAGYSGFAAALRLYGLGIDVTVLESADRVGGCVWTERRNGGLLTDHGGQWAGPTQGHLLSLVERFGCFTFETWDVGSHLEIWLDGSKVGHRGGSPTSGSRVSEYDRIVARLDAVARSVDLVEPRQTGYFAAWDAQSVEDFSIAETEYTEKNWADDPHVGGGYGAFAAPGVWTNRGRDRWRAPLRACTGRAPKRRASGTAAPFRRAIGPPRNSQKALPAPNARA